MSYTTTSISISNAVWRYWNEAYQQSLTFRLGDPTDTWGSRPRQRPLSPEELEAARQREQERQRR